MSRNSSKPTVTINKFPGLSTTDDAVEVGHTGLVRALNVDITRNSKIKRRKGATQEQAVVGITAGWAEDGHCLFMVGAVLHKVNDDLSTSSIRTGMTDTGRLCAKAVGANIYYSNGVETGVIESGVSRAMGDAVTSNTSQLVTYDELVNEPFLNTADEHAKYLSEPPAFDAIELARNGRMLYAKNELVVLSDPYSYEHIMLDEAYLPFNDPVAVIAAAEGGTYVCTTKETYFVEGMSLKEMRATRVAPYGAVRGSRTYMDGALLGDGGVSGTLPVWMSTRGLCIGVSKGVINLTQKEVVIPQGVIGTSMFRQQDGQNHIISVIQQ